MILVEEINRKQYSPDIDPHKWNQLNFDKSKGNVMKNGYSAYGPGTTGDPCAKR